MGKHCFNAGVYSRSLEWFEEAWAMAAEEKNKTLRQDQIQPFLDHASKEVRGYLKKSNIPCN
jgi:hypothetical protein